MVLFFKSRHNTDPQRCPCPKYQVLQLCHFTWQRGLTDVIKVKDLEMGRFSWITPRGYELSYQTSDLQNDEDSKFVLF